MVTLGIIILVICTGTIIYQMLSAFEGFFDITIWLLACIGCLIATVIIGVFSPAKNIIKPEYELQLINQNTVKIKSLRTDKVYKCKPEKIDSILDLDNL